MTEIDGKHAVVTGGATGIGLAISTSLANAGAKVTILSRNLLRAQDVADTLPNAQAFEVDISLSDDVERSFQNATSKFGPVDILINNAGAVETAAFSKTTIESWQRMLAVNLTGTFLCTQAALPGMLKTGRGDIVNVASTSGLKGYAYTAAYGAAKHGVIGLTRSLAVELANTDIRINAVCPGFTDTKIVASSLQEISKKTGRSEDEVLADLLQHNPQHRLIDPQEVADTVLWLCTNSAKSLTGQSIALAGGEVM